MENILYHVEVAPEIVQHKSLEYCSLWVEDLLLTENICYKFHWGIF